VFFAVMEPSDFSSRMVFGCVNINLRDCSACSEAETDSLRDRLQWYARRLPSCKLQRRGAVDRRFLTFKCSLCVLGVAFSTLDATRCGYRGQSCARIF